MYRSESQSKENIFLTRAFNLSVLVTAAVLCVENSALILLTLHPPLTQFMFHLSQRAPLSSFVLSYCASLTLSLTRLHLPNSSSFLFCSLLVSLSQSHVLQTVTEKSGPGVMHCVRHRYHFCMMETAQRMGGHLPCGHVLL